MKNRTRKYLHKYFNSIGSSGSWLSIALLIMLLGTAKGTELPAHLSDVNINNDGVIGVDWNGSSASIIHFTPPCPITADETLVDYYHAYIGPAPQHTIHHDSSAIRMRYYGSTDWVNPFFARPIWQKSVAALWDYDADSSFWWYHGEFPYQDLDYKGTVQFNNSLHCYGVNQYVSTSAGGTRMGVTTSDCMSFDNRSRSDVDVMSGWPSYEGYIQEETMSISLAFIPRFTCTPPTNLRATVRMVEVRPVTLAFIDGKPVMENANATRALILEPQSGQIGNLYTEPTVPGPGTRPQHLHAYGTIDAWKECGVSVQGGVEFHVDPVVDEPDPMPYRPGFNPYNPPYDPYFEWNRLPRQLHWYGLYSDILEGTGAGDRTSIENFLTAHPDLSLSGTECVGELLTFSVLDAHPPFKKEEWGGDVPRGMMYYTFQVACQLGGVIERTPLFRVPSDPNLPHVTASSSTAQINGEGAASINGLTLSSSTEPVGATVSARSGTLSVANGAGLDSLENNDTSAVSFSGSLSAANQALNSITYHPGPSFDGHDIVIISVTDENATATATATIEIVNPLPAAPANLQATAVSSTAIKLTWADNSSNERGFIIERLIGGSWGEVGIVWANVTEFVDRNLEPLTTYHYRVRAHNVSGQSAPSNEATATTLGNVVPASPSNLSAVSTGSGIVVHWKDNSPDEEYFVVERKLDGTNYAAIAFLSANTTTYIDNLAAGTTYCYRVKARNWAGDSLPSDEKCVTPAEAVRLLDGMKGYWKLDEASGQRMDSTPNALHLSVRDNVQFSPEGVLNGAALFGTSGDGGLFSEGSAAREQLAFTDNWTISCWANGGGLHQGANNLFSRPGEIYFWRGDNNRFTLHIMNETPYAVLLNHEFAYVLPQNEWHHICLRRTESTIDLFVDGQLEESVGFNEPMNPAPHDFWIGMQQDGWPWSGSIDEFGYWGRSLSTLEIETLYGNGLPAVYETFSCSPYNPQVTPATQDVLAGTTFQFSATLEANISPSFQWLRNGEPIQGATSSSYSAVADASSPGQYTVFVSGPGGNFISQSAVLSLIAPPTITTQPANQTVNSGSSATFTVVASGAEPLSYQWRKNGLAISGATASSYTIANVQFGNVGLYSVVVGNAAGNVVSSEANLSLSAYSVFNETFESGNLSNWNTYVNAANLNITTARNHTTGGANSAVLTNSTQKMYHNLGGEFQGHSKATFWLYDGLTTQTRFYGEIRAYSGAGYPNGSLQQLFAIGRYSIPFDTDTGILAGEAVDSSKYQGRVLIGANTGWFNLNAAGAPNRSVGWHKFEIERMADGTTINFYVDGILGRSIPNATSANWDVALMGSIGSSTVTGNAWFDDIKVEYLDAPTINTQPVSQTVNAGNSVSFSVTATGNVTGYQWRLNGAAIAGATSATYTLPNVQPTNSGTYSVVVSNRKGSIASAGAALTVQ